MALLERSGRFPPFEWESGRPHDDTPSRPVPRHSAHHHIHEGGRRCKQNRPGVLANSRSSRRPRAQSRAISSKDSTDSNMQPLLKSVFPNGACPEGGACLAMNGMIGRVSEAGGP